MPQNAYPDADVSTTGWTTTPLWSKVDDAPGAGDADYIDAAVRAGDATCELGLTEPTDPLSSVDHVIEVRARYTTNNSRVGAIKVALYEGATLRATLGAGWQTLTTAWATYSYTLSGAEADALTYSDMRLRITGHMNSGGTGTQCNVQVASVRLVCPDASTPQTTTDAGTLAESAGQAAALALSDACAASEAVTVGVALVAADAATLGESAVAGQAAQPVAGGDVAGVSEMAALASALAVSDTAAGGETSSLTAAQSRTDAGALGELAGVVGGLPTADAGSLSEGAVVTVTLTRTDAAGVTESMAVSVTISRADALNAADAAALLAQHILSDAGATTENRAATALQSVTDAGSLSDTANLGGETGKPGPTWAH